MVRTVGDETRSFFHSADSAFDPCDVAASSGHVDFNSQMVKLCA